MSNRKVVSWEEFIMLNKLINKIFHMIHNVDSQMCLIRKMIVRMIKETTIN